MIKNGIILDSIAMAICAESVYITYLTIYKKIRVKLVDHIVEKKTVKTIKLFAKKAIEKYEANSVKEN